MTRILIWMLVAVGLGGIGVLSRWTRREINGCDAILQSFKFEPRGTDRGNRNIILIEEVVLPGERS